MSNNNRVCGCFNVTIDDIVRAKENGCKSVEAVIKETQVGKACGRCKVKANLTILKVLLNRLYIK